MTIIVQFDNAAREVAADIAAAHGLKPTAKLVRLLRDVQHGRIQYVARYGIAIWYPDNRPGRGRNMTHDVGHMVLAGWLDLDNDLPRSAERLPYIVTARGRQVLAAYPVTVKGR